MLCMYVAASHLHFCPLQLHLVLCTTPGPIRPTPVVGRGVGRSQRLFLHLPRGIMPPALAPPITADGSAPSTVDGKANMVRIANLFLANIAATKSELAALWGSDWASIPEEHACTKKLFEELASYLVYIYTSKGTDKFLEHGSILNDWGGLVYNFKQRFLNSKRSETKVRVFSPACLPACLPARPSDPDRLLFRSVCFRFVPS